MRALELPLSAAPAKAWVFPRLGVGNRARGRGDAPSDLMRSADEFLVAYLRENGQACDGSA